MSETARLLAVVVGSYVLGCFAGAYYLVRWRIGADLRDIGSGNAGARNAGRVLGRAGFAAALTIDAGKGALATWVASRLAPDPLATALAMVAVIAGHLWPAQLRFRGGKGAATSLGVMLVLDPLAASLAAAAGLLILAVTRRFTISGLAAIAVAPIVASRTGNEPPTLVALAITAALVLYAHRSNLLARPDVTGDVPVRARSAPTP